MIAHVSVVIPTYNRAGYLGQALDSVAAQTYRDWEVIVVDDGSVDDTARVVAGARGPVRYIVQRNQGPSAARNAGIRAARGRYVAFLDADDCWAPDRLAAQLPLLEARPAVGLVYADALLLDEASGTVVGRHRDRHRHPSGWILSDLLFDNVIPSPTPLVRRTALEDAGLFDESLRASEDWDLWIRIARRWQIQCIDRPLATYRFHGGNTHRDTERMRRHQLAVLAKVFADPSLPRDIARRRRAILARVHAEFGMVFFAAGDYRRARAALVRAVGLRPRLGVDGRLAARLLASLLGAGAAARIAGYRRRLAQPRTA